MFSCFFININLRIIIMTYKHLIIYLSVFLILWETGSEYYDGIIYGLKMLLEYG